MDSFDRRIDELSRAVGIGPITAGCEVNQPYAQNQHQTDRFRHPHGGRSHYLGGPLREHALELIEEVAQGVITPHGSDVNKKMIDVAETLARYVLVNAPKETGRLSLSGHPWVKSAGIPIYDRPPIAPREVD